MDRRPPTVRGRICCRRDIVCGRYGRDLIVDFETVRQAESVTVPDELARLANGSGLAGEHPGDPTDSRLIESHEVELDHAK